MKPVFRIGSNDYTKYVQELTVTRNDLDADGSGRNLLDGKMYRTRIVQKDKVSVKFLPLPEDVMKSLAMDIQPEYIRVTMLNPYTNRAETKEYYTSSFPYGNQRYETTEGTAYYVGAAFDLIER